MFEEMAGQIDDAEEDNFDYDQDDEERYIVIQDDEGNDVCKTDLADETMIVYQQRLFISCVNIAKDFKIKKVIKDFQS
jgi:hypothetical protein